MTVEIVWQRVESFCSFPIFVWELPSYLLFRASSRDKACFEFSNVPLKHSFWRVCPGKPESFSFDKTFLYKRTLGDNCWSVALKCFSTRLEMCTHIEDSFFLESFFLCRGARWKGLLGDTGLSAFNFVKGENIKWKFVNCEWFACGDTWTLKFFMRYSWLSTIFFFRENGVLAENKF